MSPAVLDGAFSASGAGAAEVGAACCMGAAAGASGAVLAAGADGGAWEAHASSRARGASSGRARRKVMAIGYRRASRRKGSRRPGNPQFRKYTLPSRASFRATLPPVDKASIAARLKASKLFRGLDDAWLSRLADASRVARFDEDEPLWRAGAEASTFTIIQRGLVQIVQPTAGGESALLALFGPRESIGDAAVLERGRYPADALAATERVEVIRVAAEPVLAAMSREPQLAQAVNGALLDHTHALRAKITVMSAGAVSQRLATLLLHLADRFGDEDERGRTEIPVPLSRGALSRLVGARVETVIRCLSGWQKQGWLETNKDGFVLASLDRLEALSSGGT